MIFSIILLIFSITVSIYSIIHPERVFDFSVSWNLRKDLDENKREDAIDFIKIRAIVLVIFSSIILFAVFSYLKNQKEFTSSLYLASYSRTFQNASHLMKHLIS